MELLQVGTKIHNHKDGKTITIVQVDEVDAIFPYRIEWYTASEDTFEQCWVGKEVVEWWLDNPNVEILK